MFRRFSESRFCVPGRRGAPSERFNYSAQPLAHPAPWAAPRPWGVGDLESCYDHPVGSCHVL